MRTGSTRCILLLVASTAVGIAPAVARQEQPPQEKSKTAPPRVVTPVHIDESAPPPMKKYTNMFDPLEMQGFSVALLLGEVNGGGTPDNLPPGATKALADLREFLPYKNYRLLDTQWIRCCAASSVTGRLRGLDEQQYTFHIGIHSISGQKMTSTFSLANEDVLPTTPKKAVLSSNFAMETGETVVIGTSSLKGHRALVVLLTAVPRSSTPNTTVKKGIVK